MQNPYYILQNFPFLHSNRTSSSSSENDDSLVCESVGPINHLKYRRQRSKVLFEKDHHVILGNIKYNFFTH